MRRIPFVEEMRAAVRNDWKTQTRRVGRCPYRVGDVLGIGEPHRLWVEDRPYFRPLPGHGELQYAGLAMLRCQYQDGVIRERPLTREEEPGWRAKITVGRAQQADATFLRAPRVRSGRFLPDAFVRDRIRVTAIRTEHLQDITPEGAFAEGMRCSCMHPEACAGSTDLVPAFAALWDSLHGKGERWCDDPEVSVVSFELVR